MSAPAPRRRYPIPTHLAVEPSLIRAELGLLPVDLTFRQATILALATGLLYWLWQGSGLPAALAIPLTALIGVVALGATFVTVGGRAADLWLRDLLHYATRPHRLAWRADHTDAGTRPSAVVTTAPPPVLAWAPSVTIRPARALAPKRP